MAKKRTEEVVESLGVNDSVEVIDQEVDNNLEQNDIIENEIVEETVSEEIVEEIVEETEETVSEEIVVQDEEVSEEIVEPQVSEEPVVEEKVVKKPLRIGFHPNEATSIGIMGGSYLTFFHKCFVRFESDITDDQNNDMQKAVLAFLRNIDSKLHVNVKSGHPQNLTIEFPLVTKVTVITNLLREFISGYVKDHFGNIKRHIKMNTMIRFTFDNRKYNDLFNGYFIAGFADPINNFRRKKRSSFNINTNIIKFDNLVSIINNMTRFKLMTVGVNTYTNHEHDEKLKRDETKDVWLRHKNHTNISLFRVLGFDKTDNPEQDGINFNIQRATLNVRLMTYKNQDGMEYISGASVLLHESPKDTYLTVNSRDFDLNHVLFDGFNEDIKNEFLTDDFFTNDCNTINSEIVQRF